MVCLFSESAIIGTVVKYASCAKVARGPRW